MTIRELMQSLQDCNLDEEVVIYHNGIHHISDIDNNNYATNGGGNLIDRTKLLDDEIDTLSGINYCVVIFTE